MNLIRQNKVGIVNVVFALIGILSSLLIFLPLSVIAEPTVNRTDDILTLRFCYEDKQLLPYYAGNSDKVPLNPGASIEHLQQATAVAGISLELVRMPWLRCLQQLADNSVDALIAAYTPERAHYTFYPQDERGQPEPARAMNTNALCLAYRFDNDLPQKFSDVSSSFTLARPYGYRDLPLPEHVVVVGAHSPEQALELVVSGRVDATTVTCEINGLNANRQEIDTLPLKILQPPIYYSVGYLMLSQQFYQQHRTMAETLWQALPQTLDHRRYIEYLAYPIGF